MVSGALAMLLALAAQPTPADAAEARAAFETGVELFDSGAYSAALGPLRRAYELSGHRASTTLALAQCERKLGRTVDALVHFREFLRNTDDPVKQSRVRATIVVLERQVAIEAEARDAKARARSDAEERARNATEAAAAAEAEAAVAEKERVVAEAKARAAAAERARLEAEARERAAREAAIVQAPVLESARESDGDASWVAPVLWTTLGVVVVGGAVTAAVLIASDEPLDGGSTGIVVRPLLAW